VNAGAGFLQAFFERLVRHECWPYALPQRFFQSLELISVNPGASESNFFRVTEHAGVDQYQVLRGFRSCSMFVSCNTIGTLLIVEKI